MARYTVPKVYYQSGINANTAVEVAYIKSLSWVNKTNNNGNFELIIPMDSSLTPFIPLLDGYIRLAPGDTIMQIEKKEKICDEKGNLWYKLGGRPTLQTDEVVRDAKNNGYYFRYVYNGSNAEQYSTFNVKTPVTTINSSDILNSSAYEDDLGGFTETIEDTVYEAYSWGTIITGQPKVIVNSVQKMVIVPSQMPSNAKTLSGGYLPGGNIPSLTAHPDAGKTFEDIASVQTHEPFTTGDVPQISVGKASGANGRMDRIEYKGSWFKNDVTNDTLVGGYIRYHYDYLTGTSSTVNGTINNAIIGVTTIALQGIAVTSVRKITSKTEAEYLAEMRAFANAQASLMSQELSGSKPANIKKQVTHVEGGHTGYSCILKSKGEVEKRYKVDFKLGDTISVNDTRLGVVYTGVVSGAVETIDSSGYSVDIEIGTLGATLEQRVQKVI